MSKEERKIPSEDLEAFLHYRKRAFAQKNRKGKGSYDRKSFKQGEQK